MKKRSAITLILIALILVGSLSVACNASRESKPSPDIEATSAISDTSIEAQADSPTTILTAKLEGLDLNDFYEISFQELMMRDPEGVLAQGLADVYGLEGAELTDISDTYIRETQQMYVVVLDVLRSFDRETLSSEEQVSYDVYEWYLDDMVRGGEFMYYDYPATFFPVTAVHEGVLYFFTDLHPLADLQDAENYVSRLGKVDTKFEQLLEGLRLREDEGIIPPMFATQWAADAVHTPFYEAFEEKLDALEVVFPTEKDALLESAEKAIDKTVLPAYNSLVDYLEHLESIGSTKDGLWQFPKGDAYYAYLLRHYTTTSMTPEEIHQLGLLELDRIHAEMDAIFEELGYDTDASLPDLFDQVASDGGTIPAGEVMSTYESIIQTAEENLDLAFNIRPKAKLQVVASPIKGMYVHASLDGSRPGAFHAGSGQSAEDWYAMPTLAYHEAVPGHHFQISLAQEADLPLFRSLVGNLGYTEGWALYAEQLAWELGWYDDDPYGNIGRLQAEAFRAARLVVDTGIHTKEWTFSQAQDFFTENVGFKRGDSIDPEGQIARYIVWPGQSTSYKIGMIKMLKIRQRAMDQLGDQFDLKEYHNLVLSNGSMPLEVLERVVDDYIANKLNQIGLQRGPRSKALSLAGEGSRAVFTRDVRTFPDRSTVPINTP